MKCPDVFAFDPRLGMHIKIHVTETVKVLFDAYYRLCRNTCTMLGISGYRVERNNIQSNEDSKTEEFH